MQQDGILPDQIEYFINLIAFSLFGFNPFLDGKENQPEQKDRQDGINSYCNRIACLFGGETGDHYGSYDGDKDNARHPEKHPGSGQRSPFVLILRYHGR